MNKTGNLENTPTSFENEAEESSSSKGIKSKSKARKRKRKDSLDEDDPLPENTLEVEKNLHAAALKNNLDDESVKKILKKVVTNDHVLALVKLREEEEAGHVEEKGVQPKLTRAKMKELMKASPKPAPWNLELTPIKEIPVKTRPEVKALIAQELPDDEDDEEYDPKHDDVPSDDDQTLESCSDLDSQPRTPATPQASTSPRVVRDGPFKVPQTLTPARKKLLLEEEEATIALRTRSKLSLSETPIEHIESSFVPPDDIPAPVVDDRLWSEFLTHVLDPAAAATPNEEDDEADPEYNVAADPDAAIDEDEEALEGSILKISRKELNDLVTELFNVMPEAADDALVEDLTSNMLEEHSHVNLTKTSVPWEGKQEPLSDEENHNDSQIPSRMNTRNSAIRFSIGKSEPEDQGYEIEEHLEIETEMEERQSISALKKPGAKAVSQTEKQTVTMSVEEQNLSVHPAMTPSEDGPPPILRELNPDTSRVDICIDQPVKILPEQILILEQQLRMHIQLAVSNFLQLFVNPTHWNLAPPYKEYLEQLNKITDDKPNSVVNVCNLKPGLELVRTWESTVSKNTPENRAMVEFMKKQDEKYRRRFRAHSRFIGEFPPEFCSVLANSSVFLYPYLLPAMPYRADSARRCQYIRSEDKLIALGLDQFWQYVEANPELYPRPSRVHPRQRWGLNVTCALVCKYMFPWMSPRYLISHIHKVRKQKEGPVYKFFTHRQIDPVKHKLLPFNPNMTLYEQPEHEMPRLWVRYLAKSSKRFRDFLYGSKFSGFEPEGVELKMMESREIPSKEPLPIDFTKEIISTRINVKPKVPEPPKKPDKFDILIKKSKEISIDNELLEAAKEIEDPCVLGTLVNCNIINMSNTNVNKTNDEEPNKSDSVSNENINKKVIQTEESIPDNICDKELSTSTPINKAPSRFQKIPVLLGNKMKILNISVNNTSEVADSSFNDTMNVEREMTDETLSTIAGVTTDNNSETLNNTTIIKCDLTKEISNETTTHGLTKNESSKNILRASIVIPTTCSRENTNVTSNLKSSMNLNVSERTDEQILLVPKIPLNIKTVDSVKGPVISAKHSTQDITKENHCRCCMLLRKIMKKRQSLITEFFTPKTDKRCECTYKKYPKLSRKMRMLLNNYEPKIKRHFLDLHFKINAKIAQKEEIDNSFDLEDFVTATSFHLKLTNRLNIIRDITTKRKIHTAFTNFDINKDDPLHLVARVYKALDVEGVDLFKEFCGFLTSEQADRIGCFRDYFVHNCVERLVKEVELEIKEKSKRLPILRQIQLLLKHSLKDSACEMCESLLYLMRDHPKLAQYTFSLFPHRAVSKENLRKICNETQIQPEPPQPKTNVENLRQTAPKSSEKQDVGSNRNKPSILMVMSTTAPESQMDIDIQQVYVDDQQMVVDDQQVDVDDQQEDVDDQHVECNIQQVNVGNQQVGVDTKQVGVDDQQVDVDNQQVCVNDRRVGVDNQPVDEDNQQSDVDNQQVDVDNQQVDDNNQQVDDNNQQVNVDTQQVNIENQQMDVDNQEQDEDRLTICEEQEARSVVSERQQSPSHSEEASTDRASTTPVPDSQDFTSQVIIRVFKSENSASDTEEFNTKTIASDFHVINKEEIILEEIEIKSEPVDWRRDEDKFILEVLMEYVNKQTNKSVQMLHILEEKNLINRLCEKLVDKTTDDIKDRVAYLLLLTQRVNST